MIQAAGGYLHSAADTEVSLWLNCSNLQAEKKCAAYQAGEHILILSCAEGSLHSRTTTTHCSATNQ